MELGDFVLGRRKHGLADAIPQHVAKVGKVGKPASTSCHHLRNSKPSLQTNRTQSIAFIASDNHQPIEFHYAPPESL